jgi:thymidylate kinase
VAARRRAERGKGQEIYDDFELQRELSRFYREIDAFFPDERIVHVDSNASREEVAEQILAHVRRARGEK